MTMPPAALDDSSRRRSLEKSPEAFRTISEAAEELDVPQHVLRFWETRFSQIRPMKRGGGRRYYRPEDVDLLKGIRHLLYGKGYTIRGVQRILREEGIAHVIGIGRGEIAAAPEAAEAEPAADEGDGTEPPDEAPAAGGLTEAQARELRLAMDELAAARRLIAKTAE